MHTYTHVHVNTSSYIQININTCINTYMYIYITSFEKTANFGKFAMRMSRVDLQNLNCVLSEPLINFSEDEVWKNIKLFEKHWNFWV